MFFGEGRKHFLEFLRNLTPQVLFLTIAFISGSTVDFNKLQFNWEGIKNVIPFTICLSIFFGALIANTSLFLDNSITSNKKLDRIIKKISFLKLRPVRKTRVHICAAWRHNKPAFLQIILVMGIIEFAFITVFVFAAQSAIASPLVQKKLMPAKDNVEKICVVTHQAPSKAPSLISLSST